jgi:hypothetical protein
MALISPGVQVSVIDESFYTTAEPGTRPLFIVASGANKTPSSGSGTALGTTASKAGAVYTITSQRELAETFGDPVFKVDSNNNPIHAGELNEYGLQAAYSFLGVSNSALVVRADIDLNELLPKADAPGGAPTDGTFWLDTANSTYGIFQWDGRDRLAGGQAFTNKIPTVIVLDGIANAPASAAGTYAVVAGSVGSEEDVSIYYRSLYSTTGATATPSWVLVGSDEWVTAWPTISQATGVTTVPTSTITINAVEIVTSGTTIDGLVTDINEAGAPCGARKNSAGKLEIFAVDAVTDALTISESGAGGLLTALGISTEAYPVPKLTISKHTQIPQYKSTVENRPTGSIWLKTTEPNAGQRWRVKLYNSATKLWEQLTAPVYGSEAEASAGIDPTGLGSNIKVNSVYVEYNGTPEAQFVVKRRDTTTTWAVIPAGMMYFIDSVAPTTTTADGKLWYSSVVDEVDILINDGSKWVGYRSEDSPYAETPLSTRIGYTPVVSPTKPANPADYDLWIDTSDLEHYPMLKRYNDSFKRWDQVDVTDNTTEQGIIFADARWAADGESSQAAAINVLVNENFVDFDCPDPSLYPEGMLLWNTRRSGFNVKKYIRNYIDIAAINRRYGAGDGESMTNYFSDRWVTESANQTDGSGSFGRHAQRKVIIQSLQALVNNNEQIRDTERNSFNLMAAPGYPELIGEMINLNYDRGLTAFVVGDTPARLNPSATNLNNWGTNLMGSLQDDDAGLVSNDEYLGVFYPWGFTSNNFGRDIAVPPSHMILRTIALNDQVAYPWFAPAGTRRGNVTNATAVGYVTPEGEFRSVALNEGQRDTLYINKVNPITYFTGAGLVNFGQKTRAKGASALDRINVARLVIFLRSQLNKLAKPYIFEPNDKITRDEVKQQVESLLLELVGQRALYDFLVVCDESNNTPNRIDRSELHVDIAIEPVKAVEFIYIPIRLKNTGEIAGLGQ